MDLPWTIFLYLLLIQTKNYFVSTSQANKTLGYDSFNAHLIAEEYYLYNLTAEFVGQVADDTDFLLDFQDNDTYLTNNTTTFHDIPSNCHLFGSQFIDESPTDNITLNYTSGVYWVGANITFSRKINPIGTTSECNKRDPYGISLDDCSTRCQRSIYIVHSAPVCQCLNNSEHVIESLGKAGPCETDAHGLCVPSECMVYKRDFNTKRNVTWHEAHQYCMNSSSGTSLIQKGRDITNKTLYQDGQKYWVAYFRRQLYIWGKVDEGESVCVAANITDGKLELISRFCSDRYRAICLSGETVKGNQDMSPESAKSNKLPIEIIVGAGAGGAILFVVLVAVICKIKTRNTRTVKDHPHSETKTIECVNKETQEPEIADLHSAKSSTENISKLLSLSPTYSDPLNSLPPNVQPPPPQEVEYAVVANPKTKKQGTCKTNKNVVENENPYQTPYA